ncbi:uncharacterized protein LOC126788652 [Argentina anserina]|uniref:uncharacterized protein LOC126788652 n=1 Tax=Argentina anserina TaxID=57926 RepID=UPI0021767517|nr:uncharacterized protein LOC126788652 [Potentilla anserina]XP_050370618.1 uncharacterized protein LOC126788652 [Potentilla anserina]
MWSNEYWAVQSSPWRFEIHGRGAQCISGVTSVHYVALDLKRCTCRRWDISGLPCGHAVCAIFSIKKSHADFVDDYYTKDTYMKAYDPIMYPIAGVEEWEKIHRPIAPILYRRQPGRPPKMARNLSAGEVEPPAGANKFPKVYYSQITCKMCGKKGHNSRTCLRRNQGQNVQQQPFHLNTQEGMQEQAHQSPNVREAVSHGVQQQDVHDLVGSSQPLPESQQCPSNTG